MKKFLFFSAVAAIALTACTKQDPAVQPGLSYKGEPQIEIEDGEYFYTVNFTATKDWEAQIYAEPLSSGDPSVTIDTKSGKSGEKKIKVTFEDLEEGQSGRYAVLGVSTQGFETEPAAGEFFSIIFYQGKVFAFVPVSSVDIPVLGGSVTASFITNCDYVSTKYDQFEEWAPCVIDNENNTISFTVAENKSYDPRQAYVKFTVEEIQVPVVDEEGKPTGETKAATFRFYVNQAANEYVKYAIDMANVPSFNLSADAVISEAIYNGYHYACDGTNLFKIDPESGEYEKVEWPTELSAITYKVITNDDAGNLIVTNRTKYTGDAYTDGNFYLGVLNTQGAASLLITKAAWEMGGPAGAKVKVTGNISQNAMICVPVEGIEGIGMNNVFVYFQVAGGVVGEATKVTVNGFVGPNWGAGYWHEYANWLPNIVALGTTPADGFVMAGVYDENCLYDIASDGTATKKMSSTYMCGADDCTANFAVQSIDIRTVGGTKYLVVLASPQFPSWGWDGSSFPIIALHKLSDITTESDVFQTAKFCKVIETAGATGYMPAGEVLLFEEGTKIGMMFSDLNGERIEGIAVDPALL